jgi:hypothetical protein
MEWPLQRAMERQAIRIHQMKDRLEIDVVAFVRLGKGEVKCGGPLAMPSVPSIRCLPSMA